MSKIAVTGIKPTGEVHLGNYLGMLKPALVLAQEYESYCFIADYHALTTMKDGSQVNELSYKIAAIWLALGLDPAQACLYRQSDLPEVCELAWILSSITAKGQLNRSHAYKAARDNNVELKLDPDQGISAGLFNYPVLMAADILIMNADVVPVGKDQLSHVEMSKDIAQSFNAIYGKTLKIPEAKIMPDVAVIPGTDSRKMSKSYGNTIELMESEVSLRKKIMRIPTDSRLPEEPKDFNHDTLYFLYQHFAKKKELKAMQELYTRGGFGYSEVKEELFRVINRELSEPREKYLSLLANKDDLELILQEGKIKAQKKARNVMRKVRKKSLGTKSLQKTPLDKFLEEPKNLVTYISH